MGGRDSSIHSEAKRLITAVVFEDDAIVYIKGETNVAVELASRQ